MLTRKRERTRGIDYSVFGRVSCGLPKGETQRKVRERKRRHTRRHRQSVKQRVFERDHDQCVAYGISPICTRCGEDRHEIVPLGVGGKVTTENCVTSCRADHDAAHGEPGVGVRLVYEWSGKADGVPPNADEPGNVTPVWKG